MSDEKAISAGLNHDRRGAMWPGGALPSPSFTNATIDKHEQHDDLYAEQKALKYRRYLDAPVADVGHQDHPDDTHEKYPTARRVVPRWSSC